MCGRSLTILLSKILLYCPKGWKKSLQPDCYAVCCFQLKIHLVNSAITKMPKEERNEMTRKLEKTEDSGDLPEITIDDIPNSITKIPSTNPGEQLPVEHFEEEAARYFAKTMM